MENLAAIVPAEKAPLEIQQVETYEPGPHELLVKNELLALNPVEAKISKLAAMPAKYPAILGVSFGGTVVAVGSEISKVQVGDKVTAFNPRYRGNKFGAYQRYALAREATVSKVPEGIDLAIPVSLIGNLATVVALLTVSAGLEKPDFDNPTTRKDKKILIYGGTSSFGSLAVQYAAQVRYTVVTTTSPKHEALVSKLGAAQVVDHTQDHEAIVRALAAEGPYDVVVDSISLPDTIKITAGVLAAQGGGKIHALLPDFGPSEPLPQGVTREFASWSMLLDEEKNTDLRDWVFHTYLPQGVSSGKILPIQVEKIFGGLEGLNNGLDILVKGVSGTKLILDPWE